MDGLTEIQQGILAALGCSAGRHLLGPQLAALVGCSTRTLRAAVRSLRYEQQRWDILSRAGDDPQTDGYWLAADASEIEENRRYHEHQGLDHLSRAGHMQQHRSIIVDETTGQNLMEFVA